MNSPGISGAYWMADPAIGGAILGEACHFVDLMYWLLDSEPVEVSAFTLPTGKAHPIGENNLVASLRFADGSIGNLTYCTVGSATSGGERVEVFGDGIGVATEDFTRLDVRGRARRTQSRWWPDKGYAELVASFVDAVRSGSVPPVTVRDGTRATVGCLEMLEASRALSTARDRPRTRAAARSADGRSAARAVPAAAWRRPDQSRRDPRAPAPSRTSARRSSTSRGTAAPIMTTSTTHAPRSR